MVGCCGGKWGQVGEVGGVFVEKKGLKGSAGLGFGDMVSGGNCGMGKVVCKGCGSGISMGGSPSSKGKVRLWSWGSASAVVSRGLSGG